MKILFIAPYPFQIAPSQRFRFEQYLEALEAAGHTYRFEPFIAPDTWKILHKPGMFVQKAMGILSGFARRFALLFELKAYDYVFIHREASHIGPPVFEWLMAKVLGKRIIYDFDDAIWLPNFSEHNRSFHLLKYYRKVNRIMAWSHRIAAGNQYLCDYAAQFATRGRIVHLPTTIDTENYHNQIKQHHSGKLVIGWTGTLTTSKYVSDLLPVLQELEKHYDFEFRMISNEHPGYALKSFVFQPWKKDTEIEDLLRFDIGIMPLEDDQWAKGKCGFKALQYMALGIPPIVSPVGVNTDIVQHGANGFVCNTHEEWYKALERLILEPALRQQLGAAARETVVQRYSVLAQTPTFLQLFQEDPAKS